MAIDLEWSSIAIRLLCTIFAGALIGLNRSERGHAAGLRTTILVALAACIAMIQVNMLLPTAGKPPGSFVTFDPMRLPLGILSGIGFIGAGAIVRRDNFVIGVTTAATIWFATVIGLCFGGGQITLGLAGVAIGMTVLTALKPLEDRMAQDHQGNLSIVMDSSGPDENDIRASLTEAGLKILSCGFAHSLERQSKELNCTLRWRAPAYESKIPPIVHTLAAKSGIVRIEWSPQAK
jgi:putative Mg2+ transporter-C (MgtC) family protein